MLGMRLCVLHNLYFYNTMMKEIRDAIEEHRYADYKAEKLERVVDRLRERYGHDAVTPAVLVPAPGTEENDVPF